MATFATKNALIYADISVTEDVEDGCGPVKIGTPATFIDENNETWYVIDHPFAENDCLWILAYCSGENPKVIQIETIPETWTQPLSE